MALLFLGVQFILVVLLTCTLNSGSAEVTVVSSASGGYTCRGDHVSFYCNGTGRVGQLVWLLNGDIIHAYLQGAVAHTQTHEISSSFSAFFPNVSEAYVSELIFLNLPQNESFIVQCLFGSESDGMMTSIVGNPTAPSLRRCIETNSTVVEVTWIHTNSTFVQYYRVVVGSMTFEVRNTSLTLTLPSCDATYDLQVITVDVCGKEAGAISQIVCESPLDQQVSMQQSMQEDAIYKMVVTLVVLVVFMFAGQLTAVLYCCICKWKHCKQSGSTQGQCKANMFFKRDRTESSKELKDVQDGNMQETKIPL